MEFARSDPEKSSAKNKDLTRPKSLRLANFEEYYLPLVSLIQSTMPGSSAK
jgi:hypothetical protein